MISLNDDRKVQVLLVELQERYNASHKMRERSTQFTLWISGMAIGLAWLLICREGLLPPQRMALTLLIAALFVGALVFMADLHKEFGMYNDNVALSSGKKDSLRTSRDAIRERIRKYFREKLEVTIPKFHGQGSFAMITTVNPLDGEFDIDDGVYQP